MSTRNPESKRIPLVKAVCFLENTIALGFREGHRICIEHPVAAGLQAALIIPPASHRDGSMPIDTLAIVPRNVQCSDPLADTIYGSYLGFIRHAHRRNITRIAANDFLRQWRNTPRTESPFRYITLERLTKELKPLLLIPASASANPKAINAIRTAWARAFQCVIPHVLDGMARKQRESGERYWWILEQWEKWEQSGLDLYARFLKFRSQFRGPMPDDKTYRQMMNTFRKMCCDFLRLNYTGKTSRKTGKIRRIELRVARESHELCGCE